MSSRLSSTPLPVTQVAVLIGVRLAEPIAYTVIFPFINEMVEWAQVTHNPDRVGFYSGLVEAIFALAQFFTVYHWSKLSDRIGRRPVILTGLTGVVLSITLFGMARNFVAMLAFRSLAGALNGNVAVIKASLGDLTDETNATEAFALYGLTWTLGSIFGNTIGGALAHPAQRFGWDTEFWKTCPFLLPCLVAGGCCLIGLLFAATVYKETLPALVDSGRAVPPLRFRLFPPKANSPGSRSHTRSESLLSTTSDDALLGSPTAKLTDEDNDDDDDDHYGEDTSRPYDPARQALLATPARPEWTLRALLSHRPVAVSSLSLLLNQFVSSGWAAGSLLFFYDRNRGLSMSPSALGGAFAVNGLVSISCQLLLLTRLQRWLGLARAYRFLSAGWVVAWLLLPLLRGVLERNETPNANGAFGPVRGWAVTLAVNALLCFVAIIQLNFSLLMVIVNSAAPDRATLGRVQGLSTAFGCVAKMLGPSICSTLFAVSVDPRMLGGRLWWAFMAAVSLLNLAACMLVSGESGRVVFPEDEEEI